MGQYLGIQTTAQVVFDEYLQNKHIVLSCYFPVLFRFSTASQWQPARIGRIDWKTQTIEVTIKCDDFFKPEQSFHLSLQENKDLFACPGDIRLFCYLNFFSTTQDFDYFASEQDLKNQVPLFIKSSLRGCHDVFMKYEGCVVRVLDYETQGSKLIMPYYAPRPNLVTIRSTDRLCIPSVSDLIQAHQLAKYRPL